VWITRARRRARVSQVVATVGHQASINGHMERDALRRELPDLDICKSMSENNPNRPCLLARTKRLQRLT